MAQTRAYRMTWPGYGQVKAQRLLRYYEPERGHYWAEKSATIAIDYSLERGELYLAAIQQAWPECERIEWLGEDEKGILYLATGPEA